MSLNARTVQTAQQAQAQGSQVIQGFAMQNANNPNQSTVMSVVVDDAKAQLHRRKTDLERYFQDGVQQSLEIEVLGTEKEQLIKVLKKLDPNAGTRDWKIEDFQKAVMRSKREWEDKDRMFSGKPQKFFHKIIGKFGAHRNLFKMVPQQTNYTSLVTGAATILVSASVQHTETIEELSRVLSVIDDEAAACTRDSEFYQSEFMQRAVAKFFIAVFLLLGDVAMWYQSSGWKKMRNSLHEGFKQQFEDALQNIVVLSKNIQRIAEQGAHAELRMTRLTAEELRLELKDTRAGLVDTLRDLAQQQWDLMQQLLENQRAMHEQNNLGHKETQNMIQSSMSHMMRSKTFWDKLCANAVPLLQNAYVNATFYQQNQMSITHYGGQPAQQNGTVAGLTEHGVTHVPSMDTRPGTLMIKQLVDWAVPLLDYVQKGAGFQTLTDEETPIFFDRRIVMEMDAWLQAERSRFLYLESPKYITAAATRIVLSARGVDPPMPCASFFCNAREFEDEYSEVQTREIDPLLGLVYSLIYQILRDLPPLREQTEIVNKERFTDLDSTTSSWVRALELLRDTLSLAPSLMMIVIDCLYTFERGREDEVKDLLKLLSKQMDVEGKVLKVLFTTDRMLSSIIEELGPDEMRILDAGTRQTRGMIPFIPIRQFSDDDYD